MIDPGHLRALSQEDAARILDLNLFLKADAMSLATSEERQRLGALRLRLVQTAVVPKRRLTIPSDAFDICGEYIDRAHVWLDLSPTHVDIFTAIYFQRASTIPPADLRPEPSDEREKSN